MVMRDVSTAARVSAQIMMERTQKRQNTSFFSYETNTIVLGSAQGFASEIDVRQSWRRCPMCWLRTQFHPGPLRWEMNLGVAF